jgi:magnesium-transporting ATPase (P-type)
VGLLSNRQVNIGIICELVIIILLVYLPVLQSVFHTMPLDINDWLLLCIWPPFVLFIEEGRKALLRRKDRNKS